MIEPLEGRALLAAGALDTTFSFDGIANATATGATFFSQDLCLQSDGKTVVVGNVANTPTVARYNVDGSLDTGFGVGGFRALPQMLAARGVAMQGNSIIVVGDADGGVDDTHPAIARLNSLGSIDSAFGVGGYRVVDVPGEDSHGNDVVVQEDSKIVIAGSSDIGDGVIAIGENDFIAVRFNSNGTVDTPFGGGDGVAEIDFTEGEDEAFSIALDYTVPTSDPKYGSIFLAGVRKEFLESERRYAVAKLTPAGQYDNSFDGNGRLTTAFPGGTFSVGRDAVVQSGSRLVVTGAYTRSLGGGATDRNFMTVRYLANGAIDTSFGPGANGFLETNLDGDDAATGIAINYDGGLIVSGQSNQRMALVTYTADGDIDSRFGGGDGIQVYTATLLPSSSSNVEVATTGSTINPIRRILATGGSSGQTIRVVDVAPAITITAVDAEASETNSNTATFRVSRGTSGPNALRVRLNVGGTAIRPDDNRDTNDQDYNAVGIAFGAPFATSTVDIPAGASSVLITTTAVDDNLTEGDETATFSIAANAAYDIGSPSSTSIIIRDNEPQGAPFTAEREFLYETLPMKATFTFSQNVGASLGLDDFVVTRSTGTPPTPTFSYSSALNTATLSWATPLPDGVYGVRVKASGVFNSAGTHLNADSLNIFGVLAGDANRDGTVGFEDLVILAQNYNDTGLTFSGGNFDYSTDGKVDFPDLVILAQQYNKTLSALQAPIVSLDGSARPTKRSRPADEILS